MKVLQDFPQIGDFWLCFSVVLSLCFQEEDPCHSLAFIKTYSRFVFWRSQTHECDRIMCHFNTVKIQCQFLQVVYAEIIQTWSAEECPLHYPWYNTSSNLMLKVNDLKSVTCISLLQWRFYWFTVQMQWFQLNFKWGL
jgi:hypothetical protein